MAKKRPAAAPAPPAPSDRKSITADRFVRLYKLLKLLASGAKDRPTLTKRLGLDVRGFYRDLQLLSQAGIRYTVHDGKYSLDGDLATATVLLPYPDPVLSLGEMEQLAKGKSAAHAKLRQQLDDLLA